ncbi:hypothetical protein [Sphingomonas sp. 3-13AW]|uniref:hypothetical protein n=1 Tax=Sphingomonas sp. 3-13AW TaxID=3050450 RepID=UPI003BB7151D
MLVIQKKAEGPAWVPVMGCQVLFAPIDRKMMRGARRAAIKAIRGEEAEEGEDAADAPAAEQLEELGDALSVALILAGARDWKDVCLMGGPEDEGPGQQLPFSRENLEHALSDPLIFEALDQAYVMPFVLRERTKNVSAASQNGTGEAAMPVSDIASSPAKRAKRGGASSARTGSKSPIPRKRKASGKS